MGFLSGSQFNLVVSLRYTPAAGEMAFWCQLSNRSRASCTTRPTATLSIGQMLISPNSMGGEDADIWVHPNSDVWSNSTAARLWFPFESIDVLAGLTCSIRRSSRTSCRTTCTTSATSTTTARRASGTSPRRRRSWRATPGPATRAGPMRAGADFPDWDTFFPDFTGGTAVLQNGQPSEFCHAGNHNATANNNQNNINGNQSCWTYMANDANHNGIPYGLAAPGRRWADAGRPAAPAAVVCTELIPVQRFMLVLDRSGSMLGAKFDQLKIGANFWVDYVNAARGARRS